MAPNLTDAILLICTIVHCHNLYIDVLTQLFTRSMKQNSIGDQIKIVSFHMNGDTRLS